MALGRSAELLVGGTGGVDLEDHLDFDGDVEGELEHADGGAGVAAAFAEEVDQQLGGAVDDLRLVVKAGGAVDEAEQLDDAADAVEIAESVLDGSQGVEHDELGGGAALLDIEVLAELADEDALLILNRAVAGDVEQVANLHRADVFADWLARWRQLETEVAQAGFSLRHDSSLAW